MIHVINKVNRHLYLSVLEEMFQLRHEIFVKERGWKKLAKPDGFEIDQFDTEETTYFLKLDPDMHIIGGMRMCPTVGPTQLNTIFKESCVLADQPVGPEHYEWSRYFIKDTKYRSATGKPVFYELYTGILEYVVAMSIQSLSGFIETVAYNQGANMPWDFKQLGIPIEFGGTNGEPVGYGMPTILAVDNTMLRKTKILWRMRKPVLSLSLGEYTTVGEIGFKPEVMLAVQAFLKDHPEHIEIVANYAAAIQNVDPAVRKASKNAMSSLANDSIVTEFDAAIVDRINTSQITMAMQ